MTTYIGNAGVVKTAADGGSVAAVTEVTNFTIESTADTIDCSAMGSLNRVYKAGMQTFTGTIDVQYDPADAEQERLEVGASIDFELYPQGTTESGTEDKNYYSGSAIVNSRNISTPVDGMVTMSVAFQGSGALTKTDVS
jgi:predicted secreted protein